MSGLLYCFPAQEHFHNNVNISSCEFDKSGHVNEEVGYKYCKIVTERLFLFFLVVDVVK